MRQTWMLASLATTCGVSLVSGCGGSVLTDMNKANLPNSGTADEKRYSIASVSEDPEAMAQRIAGYKSSDWSINSVHIPRVAELRRQHALLARSAPQPAQYKLQDDEGGPEFRPGGVPTQFLGFFKDRHGHGTGNDAIKKSFGLLAAITPTTGNTLTAPIAGAPAGDQISGNTYWLTTDGHIFRYQRSNPTAPPSQLFQIQDMTTGLPTTDTFPHTNLGILADNPSLGYACSQTGTLYVFDLVGATHATKGQKSLGGASGTINFTPAPFVDYAVFPAPTRNMYVVTNTGTLWQVPVQTSTGTIGTTSSLTLPPATSGFTNLYASSPIAFNGEIFVGAWNKSNTSSSFDRGKAFFLTTSPALSVVRTFTTNTPLISAPAISISPTNQTLWAFEPAGNHVTMFDITSGASINSQDLVVDPADPANSGPIDPVNSAYVPTPTPSTRLFGGIQNQPVVDELPNGSSSSGTFTLYLTHCNALMKLSYTSPTYDAPGMNQYDPASWGERSTSFSDATQTWFTKTHLGQTMGTTDAPPMGFYISNVTFTTFDFSDNTFFAIDNFANPATSMNTSITKLDPVDSNTGVPANFLDFTSLNLGGAGANASQLGGLAIAADYVASPPQFLFNTQSNTNAAPTSTSAALWVAH